MLSQISDGQMTRGQRSVNVGRSKGADQSASSPPQQRHYNCNSWVSRGLERFRVLASGRVCGRARGKRSISKRLLTQELVLTSLVLENPLPFLFPRLGRREGILLQEECEQCARPRKIFGIRDAFIRERAGVVDQRRRWRSLGLLVRRVGRGVRDGGV